MKTGKNQICHYITDQEKFTLFIPNTTEYKLPWEYQLLTVNASARNRDRHFFLNDPDGKGP